MSKCVLITGGSGFIGTRLISYLIENNNLKIVNLDLKKPSDTSQLQYYVKGDIRNDLTEVFERHKPHYVINLAAEASVNFTKLSDYTSNIDGVRNLVSHINNSTVEKAIFYSTQYVYQGYDKWEGYEEYKPFTIYGESKKVGEEIVKCECHKSYLILRPTNIWGIGNQIYVNGLFKVMANGYYFHPNVHNVLRSYGYIDNICFQTMKLMESGETNRIFYLSDAPIDLIKWVSKVQLSLNNEPVKKMPLVLFQGAAKFGDLMKKFGLGFPMNSVRLTNMITPNPIPIEDTLNVTGPNPVELDQAIEHTVKWYKSIQKSPN